MEFWAALGGDQRVDGDFLLLHVGLQVATFLEDKLEKQLLLVEGKAVECSEVLVDHFGLDVPAFGVEWGGW